MTMLSTTTATMFAAQATGLEKHYGRGQTAVRALDGVDLELPAGQLTAVMGPSGSGKSTLVQCLAGLDTPDAGSVRLGEVELTRLSERQRTLLRRDQIGFVFQSFNLVPALTARENILLPLTLGGRKPDLAWLERLVAVLALADRLEHRPAELSGGQQQRVAVARALVSRPTLVFADEPTGALDSRSGQQLLGLLRSAVDDMGQTIVMVTHDPRAAAYADRVVFLSDGRLVDEMAEPTVDAVLDRMGGFETPAELS